MTLTAYLDIDCTMLLLFLFESKYDVIKLKKTGKLFTISLCGCAGCVILGGFIKKFHIKARLMSVSINTYTDSMLSFLHYMQFIENYVMNRTLISILIYFRDYSVVFWYTHLWWLFRFFCYHYYFHKWSNWAMIINIFRQRLWNPKLH